ncbi:response regulator [Consotaella aegiceratis]|uniref:response regulator n=1 Tax=Consotaella aegiceratis TaxID=3097961 RepID=UPI002F40A24F
MPRILVIEDRLDALNTVGRALESQGYVTCTADDGDQGLSLLGQGRFDCVFIDIFMPKLDGLGTIRQIRSIDPDIPIVVISGHPVTQVCDGRPDFLRMAVKLGAAAALRMPLSADRVIDAADQALATAGADSALPGYRQSTVPAAVALLTAGYGESTADRRDAARPAWLRFGLDAPLFA